MEKVRLGDIFEYMPKSKIKAGEGKKEGKYKFFTSSNIQDKYIDEFIYDGEYLIFGTGGKASINYCNEKFSTSTDNFVVKVRKDINTKFVYLYFKNDMQKLEKGFKGASIKHISKDYINQLMIPIYDFKVQNKIVNELNKIQEIIDLRKKQIEELDELIKYQFVKMFGTNEEGFKCSKIDFNSCIKNMLKGPFGSDIKKSLYVPKSEDTYKVYIQINAINKNQTLGDYWISKEYFDRKMFKFELKPKDYIVTCDGTLGKLLRLDENMERGIISASLLRITLDENVITPEYFENVWSLFMLDEMKKDIRNACLTHLPSAKVIGKIKIPLPSMEKQNKFSAIVKQINKNKSELNKNLKEMENLQGSLMNKYFL